MNIAVVGAGSIARTHIDAYLAFPRLCTIRAVCNWHREKAQALLIEKGLISASAYTDLEEAYRREPLDAVSICLPPAQHAEVAVWALEHGLHVLCEKPMANSLEECDRMIASAEKNGRLLAIVSQLRWTDTLHRIKVMLDSRRFGRPLYTKIDSMWWRGTSYYKMYWRGTWAGEGGGVLTAQAIHHLDLTQYLLGMPQIVTAVMANLNHDNSQMEDMISATLQYPGSVAQFDASLVSHGQRQEISVYTDQCLLSMPWSPDVSCQMENGYAQRDEEKLREVERCFREIPPLKYQQHTGQVLNFLRSITGEEPLVSDGRSGRNVIELTTAAYLSALEHRPVTLPLDRTCRLYTTKGKAAGLPHFHEKKENVAGLGDGAITLASE